MCLQWFLPETPSFQSLRDEVVQAPIEHASGNRQSRWSVIEFVKVYRLEATTILFYGWFSFFLYGTDHAFPLFTQETKGHGLSLARERIALFLMAQGIAWCACQLVIYPPIADRFGNVRAFQLGCLMLAVSIPAVFLPSLLPDAQAMLLVIVIVRGFGQGIIFTSVVVLINNS